MMHAPVRLDHAVQLIHEGRVFTVVTGTELAASQVLSLALITPADKEVHLRFNSQFSAKTDVQYYKNATCTGGTTIPSFNKNFRSSLTPGVVIKAAPTITVAGDLIMDTTYGSGQKSGGSLNWDNYILAPNTTYIMTVTSGAGQNTLSTQFIWAEL